MNDALVLDSNAIISLLDGNDTAKVTLNCHEHCGIATYVFREKTEGDGKDKLIACRMTIDEIAKHIGVDSLGYLSVEGVRQIAKTHSCGFCDACFTRNDPVPVTDKNPTDKFSRKLLTLD